MTVQIMTNNANPLKGVISKILGSLHCAYYIYIYVVVIYFQSINYLYQIKVGIL